MGLDRSQHCQQGSPLFLIVRFSQQPMSVRFLMRDLATRISTAHKAAIRYRDDLSMRLSYWYASKAATLVLKLFALRPTREVGREREGLGSCGGQGQRWGSSGRLKCCALPAPSLFT
jgi:hypothetical protein